MTNHALLRVAGMLFASSFVLASLSTPLAALAADPAPSDIGATGAQPTDAAPSDAAPADDVMDDGFDGEVVYDPYFVSPAPDATSEAATAHAVLGGTARPQVTPPATDTENAVPGPQGGPGVPSIVVALAALSITIFALGRIPAARRR